MVRNDLGGSKKGKIQSSRDAPEATIIGSVMPNKVKIEPEVLAELEIINLLGRELGTLIQPVTELTKIFSCISCNAHFPSKPLLDKHCASSHPEPDVIEDPETPADEDRINYKGYHKLIGTEQYFCNYCTYHSSSQAAARMHSSRLHWDVAKKDETSEPADESEPNAEKKKPRKRKLPDDGADEINPSDAVDSVSREDKIKIVRMLFENPSDQFMRKCPCCYYRSEKRSNFREHVRRMHRDIWLESNPSRPKPSPHKTKPKATEGADANAKKAQDNGVSVDDRDEADWWKEMDQAPTLPDNAVQKPVTKVKKRKVAKATNGTVPTVKRSYKCDHCESEFTSKKAHGAHMRESHQAIRLENIRKERMLRWASTGYACHHCSFVGSTVESTERHSKKNHDRPMGFVRAIPATSFGCHHCYFTCEKRRDMVAHIKTHRLETNETGVYDCSMCNFSSQSRECLQRHITVKHTRPVVIKIGEPFECKRCDFQSPNEQVMNWHKKQHELPEEEQLTLEISCNECKFFTWNKPHLLSHMRKRHKELFDKVDGAGADPDEGMFTRTTNENGEIIYSCNSCEYTSNNKWVLKIHSIRKHTDGKSFECDQCGKRYNLRCDLSNHVKVTHDAQKSVMCDVCGKVCRNNHGLHVHQKNKHFRPKFACPHCPKRMVTQANLDDHILRQHEQKQDYICEECGKVFKESNRLRLHMPVHTGARPWKCKLCPRAFGRRNGLRQHLLTHSKEKPYICDVCGKAFTQKTGLICHRKSHKGPLPPLPACPRAVIDRVISDLLGENESSELTGDDD